MNELVQKLLPWLSAALTGGPVGVAALAVQKVTAALGAPINSTADSVKQLLNSYTAEQLLAIKEVDNSFALEMKKLGYQNEQQLKQLDVEAMRIVNTTIQDEIKNADIESWLQKNWRPLCGLAVAIGSVFSVVIFCIAFLLSLFLGKAEAISALPALASAVALILGVPGAAVGITAWHAGKEDRTYADADLATAKGKANG